MTAYHLLNPTDVEIGDLYITTVQNPIAIRRTLVTHVTDKFHEGFAFESSKLGIGGSIKYDDPMVGVLVKKTAGGLELFVGSEIFIALESLKDSKLERV